jgi:hypothetical protein
MKIHTRLLWRVLSLVLVFGLAFSPAYASLLADTEPPQHEIVNVRGPQDLEQQSAQPPMPALKSQAVTEQQALAKFYPSLLELVKNSTPALPHGYQQQMASSQPILVMIMAAGDSELKGKARIGVVDRLKGYFVDSKLISQTMYGTEKIAKEQQFRLLYGKILPYNLLKVAWDPAVLRILPVEAERQEYNPVPADDTQIKPGPKDWAELRASAEKLREGSQPWSKAKAFGDGRVEIRPSDWFDVSLEGPHKVEAAWERGYKGQGVTVAVIDDGVDFAHPDLMGSQKIYNSTVVPQYNGWPMVMDPFSMRAYFTDLAFGTTYVSGSYGGVTYIDTSETPALSTCGPAQLCFSYTPLLAFNTPGFNHTYIIDAAMTKSNVVHVGTHVDESLRDYVWGEKVAVLVTDPHTAGVYDTVYVDLNDDYDFRDEKPLTKATYGVPSTYNNMIAYRDMNGDGLADLSGGMLYFIADGVHCVPGMDWLFGCGAPINTISAPGNGELIALHGPWDSGYSHGTQCASNVVAHGTINGMLPEFRDLPPGPGKPSGAVFGAAPEANLVPMNTAWSFAGQITYFDAYMLAAVGWDGVDQTGYHIIYGPGYTDTDAIQISSNSYSLNAEFNDGWDILSQYVPQVQRYYAPYLQFLFGTGNGGPGYGTATPPSPSLGIAVGASSEYGSTGWDTITDTNQIMFNDMVPFSNAGPSALSGAGTDVLGSGAFAAGDEELNYYSPSIWSTLDGNLSWNTWGGTSRSSATAMGVLALIYQAYKSKHGTWPTADQAKAILMSSATDINNDVFKQGSGSVNADRGTLVAGGHIGIYAAGDSYDWTPGDYRGTTYPGFAQVVKPGDTWNKTFTLYNASPAPVTVGLSDSFMDKLGEQEFSLDVTPDMMAAESAYGAANSDNFYKAFNYFIPITAQPGNDPSWYNINIPSGTDLMIVRQIFPYSEFDPDSNYVNDNRFYLTVYNWKDINSNGTVWMDKDGNGVVNFINDTAPSTIDGAYELVWDDPRTELERWEYGRFGYNRPTANVNEMRVSDPLGRMHDGLFLGLRHVSTSLGRSATVHLRYRFEFYQKADVPWLYLSTSSLLVPAGSSATFNGKINVPADMPAGDYSAEIEVQDPGWMGLHQHTTIIPVAMNVAADFSSGAVTLGGEQTYVHDLYSPYNNGAVRGLFDWSWRQESGDWRAYYLDIDNDPVVTTLYTQNFDADAVLPADWTVTDVSGIWGEWVVYPGTHFPGGYAAHSDPNLVYFNSYNTLSGTSTRLWRNVSFDFSAATAPSVTFWMFHDDGVAYGDTVQVQVSTDGGTTWIDVGPAILRYVAGVYAWQEHSIDLSVFAGEPSVLVGFLGTSDFGNDCHLDDIRVVDYVSPFPPGAHVIVKDEWADYAPHTDIDTVVLGPQPSKLSNVMFGLFSGDWTETPFFGPYVLDVVGQSAVKRSGSATWQFNTTSGSSQDWISFPLSTGILPQGGGLFELLQHNVLFEGDQFDVVFTKKVGLLKEDRHSFNIDTYMDQGQVGQVTLESTIPLSGLVGNAYLVYPQSEYLVNEQLDFTGAGTIEWTKEFSVADATSIYLETSSADVPNLDLYLLYWNGADWTQVSASVGSSAAEAISYPDPVDGDYMIAIDNYSGPAGTFNLYKEVTARVPGLKVELPEGPVDANTPVVATILYDYPLEPGKTYAGLVTIGTPEGPQLKEIQVTINRLVGSAGVSKTVDFPIHFPTDNVLYTIDLFNKSDASAIFDFVDKIPDGTTFVDVSGWLSGTLPMPIAYNPATNAVEYSGSLNLSPAFGPDYGFNSPGIPDGWTVQELGPSPQTWWIIDAATYPDYVHSGSHGFWHNYDIPLAADSWLYSPAFVVSYGDHIASFWAYSDTLYPEATVKLWVVKDGAYTQVWDQIADENWLSAEWRQVSIDLSTYIGEEIQLAWQYVGLNGECFGLDDVHLPTDIGYKPVGGVTLTVSVDNTVLNGSTITNIAAMTATHITPLGVQTDTDDDAAVFQVGWSLYLPAILR